MIKEYWKDIPGYEVLYQASNLGKIRRMKNGMPTNVLKLQKLKNGYLSVMLSKDNKSKRYSVHRLIALTWIPNPNNYPVVNHRDGCRDNNIVENLEWCTQSYNLHYKDCLEKLSKAHINHPALSKPVRQYTLDGKLIGEYPSAAEAERQIGVRADCIEKCRNGKAKTHAGFIWKYVEQK